MVSRCSFSVLSMACKETFCCSKASRSAMRLDSVSASCALAFASARLCSASARSASTLSWVMPSAAFAAVSAWSEAACATVRACANALCVSVSVFSAASICFCCVLSARCCCSNVSSPSNAVCAFVTPCSAAASSSPCDCSRSPSSRARSFSNAALASDSRSAHADACFLNVFTAFSLSTSAGRTAKWGCVVEPHTGHSCPSSKSSAYLAAPANRKASSAC